MPLVDSLDTLLYLTTRGIIFSTLPLYRIKTLLPPSTKSPDRHLWDFKAPMLARLLSWIALHVARTSKKTGFEHRNTFFG
jgi:hypothetical protein